MRTSDLVLGIGLLGLAFGLSPAVSFDGTRTPEGGSTVAVPLPGETTNLAARLQTIAEPGTLLICPETHRLLGVLFDYHDLGRHDVKGFARPVHVHQVTGTSKVQNRFEARNPSGASPILGREEELELLLRRWQRGDCR